MGFKRDKTYKLTFTEGEYAGFVVRLRPLNTGELNLLAAMDAEESTVDDLQAIQKLLAHKLVDWNYEDENDNPIPATVEGVQRMDVDFLLWLVQEWMVATIGVDAPLLQPAKPGETSQVGRIPMELPSNSHGN